MAASIATLVGFRFFGEIEPGAGGHPDRGDPCSSSSSPRWRPRPLPPRNRRPSCLSAPRTCSNRCCGSLYPGRVGGERVSANRAGEACSCSHHDGGREHGRSERFEELQNGGERRGRVCRGRRAEHAARDPRSGEGDRRTTSWCRAAEITGIDIDDDTRTTSSTQLANSRSTPGCPMWKENYQQHHRRAAPAGGWPATSPVRPRWRP